MKSISLGLYKHYKGNLYEVVGVATHSETLEELVVYYALYPIEGRGDKSLWVRPYEMFTGTVAVDGKEVPRFEYIGDKE